MLEQKFGSDYGTIGAKVIGVVVSKKLEEREALVVFSHLNETFSLTICEKGIVGLHGSEVVVAMEGVVILAKSTLALGGMMESPVVVGLEHVSHKVGS